MSTNTWDRAKSLTTKHAQSGGIFARLSNDGDKITGAFCGQPYAREVLWTGERYETFDPELPAHAGKKPSLRVALNFYVPAEKAMKIIEGGTQWFKDVLKVRDKYGLDKHLFEIERHGDAGDPKTTYSILPDEKIDDALRATLSTADLHDLERMIASSDAREGTTASAAAPATSAPRSGPIEPRAAGEIVARLKSLPRPDLDQFLTQFRIARVRDLAAADESAARTLLAQLEARHRPGDAQEVDPFA